MWSNKRVCKRDGSTEPFFDYKISDAIAKAFASESRESNPVYVNRVLHRIEAENRYGVEEIQDIIEEELHNAGEFKVMKSFITYRFLHKMQREHSCRDSL